MHNFSPRNELESSCELVSYLEGLWLSDRSSLNYHVLKVAVWAKLKDHDHIVFGQKAVINLGSKEAIGVNYF